MNKIILFVIFGLSVLAFSVTKADELRIEIGGHDHHEVRDVRDLEAAHNHILDTIHGPVVEIDI